MAPVVIAYWMPTESPHPVDEEEDEGRYREHRDRRDDVHERHVLDAVALHEQGIGPELSDPVGADHHRQQEVEEQRETPLSATKGKGVAEQVSHRLKYGVRGFL